MRETVLIRAGLLIGFLALAGVPVLAADSAVRWLSPHFTDHPLVGSVWSGDGKRSSRADMDRAAASSNFVLLGEIHSNPDHHRLQAELLDVMVEAGRRPAVVFEMIPAAYQQRLDAFIAEGPSDAAGLGAAVEWEKRGWPQWTIYQPIADAALAAGLPIMAGDLDRETIRTIGRKGRAALASAEQARLSLDDDFPEQASARLKDILQQSHCNLLPEQAIEPMILVQRARDGALAAAMMEAGKAGGGDAVLIAGGGHVRRDLAVPRILGARLPGSRTLAVAFIEVDEKLMSAEDYDVLELYDFVIFTPRADLTDHCAGLAEQMKTKPAPSPQ